MCLLLLISFGLLYCNPSIKKKHSAAETVRSRRRVRKKVVKENILNRVSAAWNGACWEMRDYSAVARNPQIHLVSNSGTGSGTSLDSPKVANGMQKLLFLTVTELKCRWCLVGERRTSRVQREGRKWSSLWQLYRRNTRIVAAELRLAGKLAHGRGGSNWAYMLADVEDAWLDWGKAKWVLIPTVSSVLQAVGCPPEYPGEPELSLVGCVCEWVCGGGSA